MSFKELLSNPGFIMLLTTLIAAPLGIYTILVQDAKKRGVTKDMTKKYAKVNKHYHFLYNNFLTRKQFRQLVEMISRMSIYNFQEVRLRAVKYYETTTAAMIGVWCVGSFVFRDIIASCVLALLALIIRTQLVNKRIDDSRRQLLIEFSRTLSSLRATFTIQGNIPDAISLCQKGPLLQKSFESLYVILTASDGQQKLNEFYATCQFRNLKTLASACYILSDMGDSKTASGESIFQTAIDLIKNEVDLEISKIRLERLKFGVLEYLPLIPLFVVRLVESFFMNNIPGTSVMYKGMLGYVVRLVIVLLAFVGYYVITTINSPTYVRSNDRLEWVDAMLQKRWFANIVRSVQLKDPKRRLKMTGRLKNCLSQKDIPYIYAEKVCFGTICFVFIFIATVVTVSVSKNFVYENMKSLSLLGGMALTQEEEDKMYTYDCKVLNGTSLPSDNTMAEVLKPIIPSATEMDRLEQVERIKTKYNKYHDTYYRWWYLLICYSAGIIGWMLPAVLVKLREFMVKNEALEDVLQMQTIIATLMDTSLDTLDVLYWLEHNSQVHKDVLLFAYHEYPSDPEKALNRLKSRSTIPEFHQICDSLLSTVHQISLSEAFADLINERDHIMRDRLHVQEAAVNNKRMLASPLALAPLFALAFGEILAPIGILGYMEFVKAFAQAGL